MHNSKQLAVMFLLGAFVVGGALGFTADRVWGRDAACRDPRGSRELLYERLDLTSTQRAAALIGYGSSSEATLPMPLTTTPTHNRRAALRESISPRASSSNADAGSRNMEAAPKCSSV